MPYVFLIFVLLIFLIYSGIAYGEEQFSTNYTIERTVLCGGVGYMGSTTYYLLSTLSQPSTTGPSSSGSYKNYAGFWHPGEIVIGSKAMPWLLLLFRE